VFPLAGLAQALARRGHEPLVVVAGRWLPALHRAGLPAEKLHQLDANSHPGGIFAQLHGESARLAPVLVDTLRPFAPDCVIADVISPFGGYAAALLGVPWLQLVPHPLQDPSPYLPPPGSGFAPATGPGRRVRDQLLYRLVSRDWQRGVREQAAARATLGLPADGRPVARLIAAAPALDPPRRDWPADAFPVGPLEWDPAEEELALPPGDGPLAFLSASTVAGGAKDLLGTALAGFGGASRTGGASDGVKLRVACTQFEAFPGSLPKWAVAGPGRQGPVIDAASVVISGAGHGIVAKALARGVPLVVVPGVGEQAENAGKLVRAGLGLAVAPRRLTPTRLAAAVRTVLTDPGFAERARACAGSRERPQGDVAVDVIERAVDSR
jgi:UDP:flavonoid glycosyltransferase YjiC (YdhE family)